MFDLSKCWRKKRVHQGISKQSCITSSCEKVKYIFKKKSFFFFNIFYCYFNYFQFWKTVWSMSRIICLYCIWTNNQSAANSAGGNKTKTPNYLIGCRSYHKGTQVNKLIEFICRSCLSLLAISSHWLNGIMEYIDTHDTWHNVWENVSLFCCSLSNAMKQHILI